MAQNDYDKACRYAAQLDPVALISWLLGVEPDRFIFNGWLDTRSIPLPGEPDRTCDTVARLDLPGNGAPPWAMPIEFQTEPDPLMFGRLLAYLSQLWLQLKPDPERGSRFQVGAVVVNLTGEGNSSREMHWPGTGLTTHLAVVERNLARESADELLSAIESGQRPLTLLPWIPLMTGADSSVIIERWKRSAESETDQRRRSGYASLARVLADAAGRKDIGVESLKGWNVLRSSVAEEWREEGRIEGRVEGRILARQEAVEEFLSERFGAIPPEVIAAVRQCIDMERFRRWVSAAAKSNSLAEFRAAAGI